MALDRFFGIGKPKIKPQEGPSTAKSASQSERPKAPTRAAQPPPQAPQQKAEQPARPSGDGPVATGSAAGAGGVAGTSGAGSGATPNAPKDNPYAQYHVVEKGDTLSKIAQKYYGDPMLCPKIFEANRDVLDDPNRIYPGQKLHIP